jgi:hypothetical protein
MDLLHDFRQLHFGLDGIYCIAFPLQKAGQVVGDIIRNLLLCVIVFVLEALTVGLSASRSQTDFKMIQY